jgi:hypothetical protein
MTVACLARPAKNWARYESWPRAICQVCDFIMPMNPQTARIVEHFPVERQDRYYGKPGNFCSGSNLVAHVAPLTVLTIAWPKGHGALDTSRLIAQEISARYPEAVVRVRTLNTLASNRDQEPA